MGFHASTLTRKRGRTEAPNWTHRESGPVRAERSQAPTVGQSSVDRLPARTFPSTRNRSSADLSPLHFKTGLVWANTVPRRPTRAVKRNKFRAPEILAKLTNLAIQAGAAATKETPSPPSDGGEGRGEEARCYTVGKSHPTPNVSLPTRHHTAPCSMFDVLREHA